MLELIDTEEVRRRLRAACEAEGSQMAFAAKHGIHRVLVSNIISGRREPTYQTARALGLTKVTRYVTS